MEKTFEIIRTTRENVLTSIKDLSTEQLNTIPSNFNNNIAWHLGHLVCSQQKLCYQMSGLDFKLPAESFEKFGKGTRPEGFISSEEIEMLKSNLVSNINDLESDFKSGLFRNYKEYETSYRVVLRSIEDTLKFLSVHEGLHFGYVMALKRLV